MPILLSKGDFSMGINNDYLSDIYRGVRMGAETLDSVIARTHSRDIKKELIREKRVYRDFEDKTLKEINSRGASPKPINAMQKNMAKMGIAMNTAFDKTPSHIADLVIQGNNMGIIGMTKAINNHKNRRCDEKIEDLAKELVSIQEDNIKNLKPFL